MTSEAESMTEKQCRSTPLHCWCVVVESNQDNVTEKGAVPVEVDARDDGALGESRCTWPQGHVVKQPVSIHLVLQACTLSAQSNTHCLKARFSPKP
jgi:hypothetical protein